MTNQGYDNGSTDTILKSNGGGEYNIKKQMMASIVGGMVTAMVVTPLDVVKTRLQTQTAIPTTTTLESSFQTILNHNNANTSTFKQQQHIQQQYFKGTFDAFIKITKNEGIFTLWRGLTPSLLMTIPSTAIYFTTYEYLKKDLLKYFNNGVDYHQNYHDKVTSNSNGEYIIPILIAGSLARVVSATVTSPFELIRTNSQGLVSHVSPGSSSSSFHFIPLIRGIINNVGILGLWRGLSPTLLRDVPFSALYWAGYEFSKNTLTSKQKEYQTTFKVSPFFINFISGAISGSIAAIATTPIDVIKTRIQMTVQQLQQQHDNTKTNATNIYSPIKQCQMIYQQEGWRGFTKGMVPRVVKVSPACAIMVSTYEFIKESG